VIPVEVTQALWRFTTPLDALDHWQTLFAGGLAVLAAWRTIRTSQKQTVVAQKQIATTLRLDRRRVASEGYAFCAMLKAAMDRVLAEAAEAKDIFAKARAEAVSDEAHDARTHFTKMGFDELRGACVRYGGLFTAEFLELESQIDDFASPRWMQLTRPSTERLQGMQTNSRRSR
jgi:hypothetical protein